MGDTHNVVTNTAFNARIVEVENKKKLADYLEESRDI